MRRREFFGVIGGAAAWPLGANAQKGERVRRIAILLPAASDDAEFQTRVGALLQALQQLGWSIGRNVRIDTHWATANAAEIHKQASELALQAPDIIVAHGTSTVRPMLQETQTIPIVFPVAADPVGAGLVNSLARPGGNVTGFMVNDYSISGKWLELLQEVSPNLNRVAVLRDPTQGSGTSEFAVIQAMAQSLRVEVNAVNVRDPAEIERAVAAFSNVSEGGLIVTSGGSAIIHRDLIIRLASQRKLPTVYFEHLFVSAGGLMSYGASEVDQYRQAASYVDRILKGEKPADLPVQTPIKYELAINLKAANAIGLAVPPTLIARADEVIE